MKIRKVKKQRGELVPGTIIKCQSGRYIAFYEHRTDIIANGENEVEAKRNLKLMYDIIREHEIEENEKSTLNLPDTFDQKKFTEKMPCL